VRVDVCAPAGAFAVPAATRRDLPPRITIEPRSITVPLPTITRAFVTTRSCASDAGVQCEACEQRAERADADDFTLSPFTFSARGEVQPRAYLLEARAADVVERRD